MAGEVSFFELGLKQPAPARGFYGELFGWTMKPRPERRARLALRRR
jgi:predicted enzyme related to lactoylglutathione lyase